MMHSLGYMLRLVLLRKDIKLGAAVVWPLCLATSPWNHSVDATSTGCKLKYHPSGDHTDHIYMRRPIRSEPHRMALGPSLRNLAQHAAYQSYPGPTAAIPNAFVINTALSGALSFMLFMCGLSLFPFVPWGLLPSFPSYYCC